MGFGWVCAEDEIEKWVLEGRDGFKCRGESWVQIGKWSLSFHKRKDGDGDKDGFRFGGFC